MLVSYLMRFNQHINLERFIHYQSRRCRFVGERKRKRCRLNKISRCQDITTILRNELRLKRISGQSSIYQNFNSFRRSRSFLVYFFNVFFNGRQRQLHDTHALSIHYILLYLISRDTLYTQHQTSTRKRS